MTMLETAETLSAWAQEAVGSVLTLEVWLRELRTEVPEVVLSMASRRRISAALAEAEENLLEIRPILYLLAYGKAADPSACRLAVTERACESLASWRVAVEAARARGAEREGEFLNRFGPLLAAELRKVVESLRNAQLPDPATERRLQEDLRLLARPDIPVM